MCVRERERVRGGGGERENRKDITSYLIIIQSDAEIDAQDSNGFTALLYAVRQGHNTVVQLLLEAGADLSLTLVMD